MTGGGQDVLAHHQRHRDHGDCCQQREGTDEHPPACVADVAAFDVAGDALTQEGGEPPIPALQYLLQRGAAAAALPGDEQRAERSLDLGSHP